MRQPSKTHHLASYQWIVPKVRLQVLGVDFAGPIAYKISKKKEGKAYILLFACSLTRAVHLELLTDQTTEGFIRCLKRFIARRGRPNKPYSDNGRSFVSAAKWLKSIMKNDKTQDYLANHNIIWKFNLSRAKSKKIGELRASGERESRQARHFCNLLFSFVK